MLSVQAGGVNENKIQYAIDRIEEGAIAVCQNLLTGEIVEIEMGLLPQDVHDGSILDYVDGEYKINLHDEKVIRERVRKKLDSLINR